MKKLLLALLILSSSIQTFCSGEELSTLNETPPTLQELALNASKLKIECAIEDGADFEKVKTIVDFYPHLFSEFINHKKDEPRSKHYHLHGYSFLTQAILQNNPQKVQRCLDLNADVNQQGKYGNTLLHFAARENADKVIPILLDAGLLINQKNNDGNTPLHRAAVMDNTDKTIQLLVANGADTTIKDFLGRTAKSNVTVARIRSIFDRAETKRNKMSLL